jgi:hypothetical protein
MLKRIVLAFALLAGVTGTALVATPASAGIIIHD